MPKERTLRRILEERIAILDGAMGTMVQSAGLDETAFRADRFAQHPRSLQGDNEVLSLTQPRLVEEIHRAFLEAGADIIETNTFNANAISQAEYDLAHLVYDMNRSAAAIAVRAAAWMTGRTPERPRFVAGSMGPTNQTLSISPRVDDPAYRAVDFDRMCEAYAVQARGLIDGGVDILLIETSFDTLNFKAALMAVQQVFEEKGLRLPVMLSGTVVDASGRTLSGQTVHAFWISVSHMGALSVGLNCGLGAEQMAPHILELSRVAPIYTSLYPNAGFPNEFGQYDQSPREMAALMREYAREGLVNIAGGCCGTTPSHIQAIAEAVSDLPPRRPPASSPFTELAGLEPLVMRPDSAFIVVGERTNVTGSKTFARLVETRDFEGAMKVADRQVEGGANILDVNMDAPMLDSVAAMETFLRHLASEPRIARIPIMIDSSRFEVIEAGLKNIQGKGVVNSISLKEGEEVFLRQARRIKAFGAAVVVMAFDEQGQAVTASAKVEILARAYRLLTEVVGFPPQDIIFDPAVLAVATGIEAHADYANAFIEATRELKRQFPLSRVQGGISNVSFSFRGNDVIREAIHAAFLYHAIQAGLDLGIVNAGQLAVYEDIEPELLARVEDVLFNRRPDATERLVELADRVRSPERRPAKDDAWRNEDVDSRLVHALVSGIAEYVEDDVNLAHQKYPRALDIIEGPLMKGMRLVGELFQQGKMFLPQVVKSARVMKKAVAVLTPYLGDAAASPSTSTAQGRILLATVRGDVHDIGKNIAGVVLACNNYEVIDLGVMVPSERILAAAREEQVDAIGLSGLITPSLDEMVRVAREMERQGLTIPLLIGGATTSRRHTAVRIAPEYSGPTVHVIDASQVPDVMSRLLSPEHNALFVRENRLKQVKERELHGQQGHRNMLTYPEALAARLQLDWVNSAIPAPSFIGTRYLLDVPLANIIPFIDWRYLFTAWDLKGSYPALLDHPTRGAPARELLASARAMLEMIREQRLLSARGAYGLFPANSDGDDIVVFTDESRQNERMRLHLLRQQRVKPGAEQANLSLADFIAPLDSGRPDFLGAFAVTAGLGIDSLVARFQAEHDDYRAILAKILADRLAEAFAEWVHCEVRVLWGFGSGENLSVDDLLKDRYQGIRPAIGYPSLPDHTEKAGLFELLDLDPAIGLTLTESFMMHPAASVCAYVFSHPRSHYFTVGPVARDQVQDYARRKAEPVEEMERWLGPNLAYEPPT